MKYSYLKLLMIALLSFGILTLSYGGCGGGDGGNGDGQNSAEDSGDQPSAPEDMDDAGDDTNEPDVPDGSAEVPTDSGEGTCQGNAFIQPVTASLRQFECLTDYFSQNGQESLIQCLCTSAEIGPFILDIGPSDENFNTIIFEFPGEVLAFVDWQPIDCSNMSVTQGGFFEDDPLVQIGTFTNFVDTSPDMLSFTMNITDGLFTGFLGASQANAVCDYCAIDILPDCAPGL